ncbi:S-type anion channel SLAH1-like isoform X2 [Punica granatum]|uniref:S-type anion channel SLAH1-like isoform X2 n=1 Tax=Punica granatum TaxID=22663 RepID=A0A6P8BQC9_PUNGR|nr:S-type anion channel SLAH1-like isoform X2 [Punica granatum]
MESLQIPHQPPMAMRQVPVDASQPASRVQPHHHRNRANHQQTASPIRQFKPSILTRLHAGYFRISLSLASQALLLKMLTQPAAAQVLLSALYALRCCFHFQLVRAEFFHHVGVNYLFAPWISWLVLLLSSPTAISEIKAPYLALWWAFAIPVVLLDVKIYGQWFTTEKRFLSMVANPTSLISVIGNLVGSRAASRVGWKESAVCLFSLGMAHYLVLFVTLYQRLSGGDRLPAMLRPVFFLFFAAPSMASLAWNSISGTFDTGSKMLFFLSLFLFASLACRPALFKKSMRKFNVAWWAYSFPLTFLALASAEYAQEVKGTMASVLMLVLSALSFLVFLGLMLLTVLNTHRILREDDPILRFDKDRSRN